MVAAPKNPHDWFTDDDYTGGTPDDGGTGGGGDTFAVVAYSGLYNDLLSRPTFSTVAFTGQYSSLLNIPTYASVWATYTENGSIIVITNATNNAKTVLKGSGGLELTTSISTESSLTSYTMSDNPRLMWKGYTRPYGEGVPDYYYTSRVIIDYDGFIPAGSVKDFPDWYQELKTLGVSGTALGAVALAVATWAVGGTAIKSVVGGIFDKIKQAFGGDPDNGGGGGGNPDGEPPALQWNVIGGRPFANSGFLSSGGSVLGANVGFVGDITVANKTPAFASNGLYVMNYENFSVSSVTGNVVFDTGTFTSADKTLLIDFDDRIFRAKNVKVEQVISFYNINGAILNTFTPVLDLYSTVHGEWRFTKDGVFHKDRVVVSYNASQDRYIFHGVITNAAPTPASEYETGAPEESIWGRFRRRFARNNDNNDNITPADPAGNQIRQSGSQQAQQLQALRVQGDQLRAENNELVAQAAKVARTARVAKAKGFLKTINTKLKKAVKDVKEATPSGPIEAIAKGRSAALRAWTRGKDFININAAKVADAGTKAALL